MSNRDVEEYWATRYLALRELRKAINNSDTAGSINRETLGKLGPALERAETELLRTL